MAMDMDVADQSAENTAYVRRLLRQKQPGFAAALELAVLLAEPEQLSHLNGGFARDFATADGQRVMVAALTRQQFADLARTARLAGTFASHGGRPDRRAGRDLGAVDPPA
jgi:hypothetical protein